MRFIDRGSASVSSCFCISVGCHWSRNLPVCVSGSGSLVWVPGHSSDLDHRQFCRDSAVCWAAGFSVCYGKSHSERLWYLLTLFRTLLVSSGWYGRIVFILFFCSFLSCFTFTNELIRWTTSVCGFCIYWHNVCIHNITRNKRIRVLLAVPQVLVRGGLLLYNPDYFV